MRSRFLPVLCLTAAASVAAAAAEPTRVRTTGEAIVEAAPDTARFQVSVVTYGADAKEASAENARRTDALIKKLEARLKNKGEIQTEGYSIEPSRKRSRNEGPGEITGYTVRNSVSVETKEIERLGEILDAATAAGADQVNWVRFELSDAEATHAKALREAVSKARSSAEAIARALGMQVARVVSVEQQGAAPRPMVRMAQARMESTTTPIEPGEVEIRAQVALEVELGQ